jgi:hypothetical protein
MPTNDQRPPPSSLAHLGKPLELNEERGLIELFGTSEQFANDALPPISPLAPKLFDVDGEAPIAALELTEIIESDPVLTARILGINRQPLRAGAYSRGERRYCGRPRGGIRGAFSN